MKRIGLIFLIWGLIIIIGSVISGLLIVPILFKHPGESFFKYFELKNIILMLGFSSLFSLPSFLVYLITFASEKSTIVDFLKESIKYIFVSQLITFLLVAIVLFISSTNIEAALMVIPLIMIYSLSTIITILSIRKFFQKK